MANPYFNALYYLQNNPDVLAAGYTAETAEQHYLQYGASESYLNPDDFAKDARTPAPWFDIQYYLDTYPDLLANGVTAATAFHHFTTYGIHEGRSPMAGVQLDDADLSVYAAENPDLLEAFGILDPDNLTPQQEDALSDHFYQYGYLEDRPGAPGLPGNEVALTPDVDNLIGSARNDVFDAAAGTLQSGDTLDGRAGHDVLNISSSAIAASSAVAPTISNIEVINYNLDNDAGFTSRTLDLANVAGLQAIWTDFSATDTAATYANYDNATLDITYGLSGIGAPTGSGSGIHLNFAAGELAGDSTLNIALQGNSHNGTFDIVSVGSNGGHLDAGVEHVVINAIDGTTNLTFFADELDSITVNGAGNVLLNAPSFGSTATHITSFDAGSASGNMTVNFAASSVLEQASFGSGADTVTAAISDAADTNFDLGAGNDVFTLDGTGDATNSLTTITLGEGNDTVNIITGLSNVVDATETEFANGLITVTDFDTAADFLDVGVSFDATALNNVQKGAIDVADSLFDALDVAAGYIAVGDNAVMFDYGGNAYLLSCDDGAFDAGDGLVELVGVSVDDLNAANFDAG